MLHQSLVRAAFSFAPTLFRSVAVSLMACHVAAAQVALDRFYPPAVTIGTKSTVKAEGKFPVWPPTIVCDSDDVKITPSGDSGSLEIVVAPGAAPGAAWIRMHDKASASNLVPLFLEPHGVASETEPNNQVDQAQMVELPGLVAGRLAKSGDVDTFRIHVDRGRTLVVSVTANRKLRSPMDALLQLADAKGNVVVQSDDTAGLDPQIVYHADQDRELLVRVFAFPETPNSTIGYAGGTPLVYLLRATSGPFVDHVLPLLGPGDAASCTAGGWNLTADAPVRLRPATTCSPLVAYVPDSMGWHWHPSGPPDAILLREADPDSVAPHADRLPCLFSGCIDRPGEVDRVRFDIQKGVKYLARVHARRFASSLDSVLRIVDAGDGSQLAHNDDPGRHEYDAVVEYTAKADREVELRVSDLVDSGSPRHFYTVVIDRAEPDAKLSLAADHFVIASGQSLEIPVSITRLRGFQHKLRIVAEGLPSGVQAEPIVSEVKGDTAKSVKLKLTAAGKTAGHGEFRIVGHVLDADDKPMAESFDATFPLRDGIELRHFWLTVAAADQ